MSVIFIGTNSDKINSLRLPFIFSLCCGIPNNNSLDEFYNFMDEIDSFKYDYSGNSCNKTNNICTYTKAREKADDILGSLWGFDYIITLEEDTNTEQIVVLSNKSDDSMFSEIKDRSDIIIDTLADGYINTFEYKDSFDTTYAVIRFNPENINSRSMIPLFFAMAKNIRNVSNLGRWIHAPKGWLKTKPYSDYIKRSIQNSKSDLSGLFYTDNLVEVDNGKVSLFNRLGIVKQGKCGYLFKYTANDNTVKTDKKFIFIPENERYAVGGWVITDGYWHFFDPESYLSVHGTIIIDDSKYTLNIGKLDEPYENFYLDDNGVLHHI